MNIDIILPHDMIKILPDKEYRGALKFINLGIELKCKYQTRYAKSNQYWRCVFSNKKPPRVTFALECTEEWWRIKAMLSNLEQYKEELENCSENVISLIKTAYDCRRCNARCKEPNPFIIDGIEYRKCVGCSFYFSGLNEAEQDNLIRLIKREVQY
jgi:hypothetical protein